MAEKPVNDQRIKTRQRLLDQVKQQVQGHLGPATEDIRAYGQAYGQVFRGRWNLSSLAELNKSFNESRLILGGDFHAFSQSQRVHLRLLRDLSVNRPVILALECFESKNNKQLDDFFAEKISTEEFLDAAKWAKHWGFPFENYEPLVALAKQKNYKVVGLNKYFKQRNQDSLNKRDSHAAQTIIKLVKKYPNHLVYVIFGDLHLADGHLPEKINELYPEIKKQTTRVLLNSEKLYFQFAKKALADEAEILRRGKKLYCIQSSPPWVKWQSYQMYLDQIEDQDLFAEGLDYTEHLSSQLHWLCEELEVAAPQEDFSVYSAQDELFFEALNQQLRPKHLQVAMEHIREERSFWLPQSQQAYLSRGTVNHMAELAGLYLQSRFSGLNRVLWEVPEDHIRLIWVQGLAFFTSKLVNHRRKAQTLRSLKSRLASLAPKDKGREAFLMVLDQRLREAIFVYTGRWRAAKVRPRQRWSSFEAARILGQMLGERLYRAYKTERISAEIIKSYFSKNPDAEDFTEFYLQVVKRVEATSPEPVFKAGL